MSSDYIDISIDTWAELNSLALTTETKEAIKNSVESIIATDRLRSYYISAMAPTNEELASGMHLAKSLLKKKVDHSKIVHDVTTIMNVLKPLSNIISIQYNDQATLLRTMYSQPIPENEINKQLDIVETLPDNGGHVLEGQPAPNRLILKGCQEQVNLKNLTMDSLEYLPSYVLINLYNKAGRTHHSINIEFSDSISSFMLNATRQSNLIAVRTRRAAGNFIILSNKFLTKFKDAIANDERSWYPWLKNLKSCDEILYDTGYMINNTMKVYQTNAHDDILIGYKGPAWADAGLAYVVNKVTSFDFVNPDNFENMTKYQVNHGFTSDSNPNAMGDVKDYYTRISLD